MDKYEYRLKAEQIEKLVKKKDYQEYGNQSLAPPQESEKALYCSGSLRGR